MTALVELARDTDLLLAEATLPSRGEESEGHLNARAGGRARPARGGRRLVLTHFSDQLDAQRAVAEAAEGFGGPVELAREQAVYTV